MKTRSYFDIQIAIVASLVLHASFLLVSVLLPNLKLSTTSQNLEVSFVEVQPPEVITTPAQEEEPKQIVEQDQTPANDEIDEKAKYLSAHNQKVLQETLAQKRGDFKNSPGQSQGDDGGKSDSKFKKFEPAFDYAKAHDKFIENEKKREESFEKDAILKKQNEKNKKPERQVAQANKPGETGDSGSQTIDYIKEIDPGLETLLSTKEFVFYTYYSRIRKQLNQSWGPKVREKMANMYKQGRSVASTEDRVTKLLVTLNRQGEIFKVQVIGDSGVRELDEAAVEAFKSSAPFPNPPEGMVDEDGYIKIRWDFILEA
ncbi:MAG: energy transducer TonB [Pseudobdellovibrionaceae bacterium]